MNSWIKLALIVGLTWFVVRTMRQGWGGGAGGDLPKTVSGQVAKAKTMNRKLVLLITGSDWCPACIAMEKNMLVTPEWQAFAAKDIVFQTYDYPNGGEAPTPAHEDLLKLPGFQGFPTLVVADGSGKVLAMRAGFSGGAQDTIAWIKSL